MKFEFPDEKREALAKLGEYCERLTVSPHQPAVTVDPNFRGASTVRRISKLLPVPRTMAAFPLQLTLNSVLVNEEIMTTPGHSSNLLPANSQARREP
jgi:hypothetical protein